LRSVEWDENENFYREPGLNPGWVTGYSDSQLSQLYSGSPGEYWESMVTIKYVRKTYVSFYAT
jgi:hypothetical protein